MDGQVATRPSTAAEALQSSWTFENSSITIEIWTELVHTQIMMCHGVCLQLFAGTCMFGRTATQADAGAEANEARPRLAQIAGW
jgi:hypothetical protein